MAAVLVIAAAIGATSAFAQSNRLLADIPFDFYVGERLLIAGEYTITPTRDATVLRVSGPDGNSAYIMTTGTKPNQPNNDRLVFRRYGTTSFLASVYWSGYSNGREVQTSPMERQLAKNGVTPQSVALVIK
jgi:hypothetical protein